MSESARLPFGGAADALTAGQSLSDRFRRHADALRRSDRSPLCACLMYDAAADIDAGGLTAELFSGVSTPPGSVPQLRLLAALHHLVLEGCAPDLAAFYPSVGGGLSPERVWPAAIATIEANFDWIQMRLQRTVQTNEPGRSTVLFSALLWLTDRYRQPIRLLEIGASAGLNLIPDRYCYVVGGERLGDASSPVRFDEPWQPGPAIDARIATRQLRIIARAGCDEHPLDPRDSDDRLTLLSYIWPDELARIERMKAALALAAGAPAPVVAGRASDWLGGALTGADDGGLTVIWQSIFRQYVSPDEWAAIETAVRHADGGRSVVWLSMEPDGEHFSRMRLAIRANLGDQEEPLAWCGDHGPPVIWT